MINRLLVASADAGGCSYYRMQVPYKAVSKFGFDVELINRLDQNIDPTTTALVLQRQHADDVLALTQWFISIGGKVINELDDYFHSLPINNIARPHYPEGGKELKNLEKFMEISHLLTVSTPQLQEAYSRFSKNSQVCYNSLDLNDYEKIDVPKREDGIIRIGWAGSATHHDDFLTVIQPICDIMKKYANVEFVFIGMNYAHLFPFDLRHRMKYFGHTFPMQDGKPILFAQKDVHPVKDYYKLLQAADLDIAIAPLINHTFNRKKSYLKLLEYGIVKVPYVATDFGPYHQYGFKNSSLHNKENALGFVAEKNTEWRKYLSALIESKELREQVAENNYNEVIKNHTIETGVHQWIKALSTIDIIPPQDRQGSYKENFMS